jgi:hypothetical protein
MCPQCEHKSDKCGHGQSETKFYLTIPDDLGALGMFNLNLPRSAWPKFVNIYRLLLHLDKKYGAMCSLDVEADFPPMLGKYMMYCSFSYSHICIKSLLHYLFLIIYFCTLLSALYCSVLSITPIFVALLIQYL